MPQDALMLLDTDHQRVEALFSEFQTTTVDRGQKTDMALVICMELLAHASLEEELFYPAFAQAVGDQTLVQRALSEHHAAKNLIAKIQSAADPDALMLELQRVVERHVAEERSRIFPQARASGLDLVALGERMEERKAMLAAALAHA